jgi:hypothetical protein
MGWVRGLDSFGHANLLLDLVSLDPDGLSKALRSILFRLVRPLRDSRKTPVFAR